MEFGRLSTKYLGSAAENYEAERLGTKWAAEQQAVEELLRDVPERTKTLDVPVGTGRLIEYHKSRSFAAHGVDVSPDMLSEARARAEAIDADVELSLGDIRHLPFPDKSFDLVVCLRFLNWIDAAGVEAAVKELARVSNERLLLGIRYVTPFQDLGASGPDLIRMASCSVGLGRLRAKRWGLVFHDKRFVDQLFDRTGLDICDSRHVERRWDGTDYVFFRLRKR